MRGAAPKAIQELVGHSTLSMTPSVRASGAERAVCLLNLGSGWAAL
jgi:hypothetical protein